MRVTLDTNIDAATGERGAGCGQNLFDMVEYALVLLHVKYPIRGQVGIYLTSPSGMRATLLGRRPQDTARDLTFEFKSLRQWGESPSGTLNSFV